MPVPARRVLVAEDEPALLDLISRNLRVRGFEVFEATNGLEALAVWERERFGIVVEGSVHKFAAHPGLRAFLLGTGGRVLVEASPVDRVWGIGLAANDDGAFDPRRWPGENLLGFALMEARERLRAGDAPTEAGS